MIKPAILSKTAVSAPRRALLLTVISWMNIAMAPCAMAFDGAPGCLHGESQAESPEMAHHGGHEGHGAQHDGASGPDCGLIANDCCATKNDGVTDTRGQKTVEPDCGENFAPLSWQGISAQTVDTATCRVVDRPPGRFVTSPPIHVLNCVYRD